MIYLDNGATSFHKPEAVKRAVMWALENCANPGRGGYRQSNQAARIVVGCREQASRLFDCKPEQVVFTSNCTHGLNIAIHTLVKPGSRVIITGFEHNAVLRPLIALKTKITVVGRKVFDWEDTLSSLENALKKGADAAVFTHVSNVFGYILPIEKMCDLCNQYGVPYIIDAAQSAGYLPLSFADLSAEFVAMPGHKGLLGPQGTGILLCKGNTQPIIFGGTGSVSASEEMPDFLPDRLEAGTLNVPGIAGLHEGLSFLLREGIDKIFRKEMTAAKRLTSALEELEINSFSGPHQSGTVSFVMDEDCEIVAQKLADRGIAVRAGLHCAPLAHKSVGTFETGTVRVSFGLDATLAQIKILIDVLKKIKT